MISVYKIAVCVIILTANFILCKDRSKKIEYLPKFRKKIEEISHETPVDPENDLSQNLVSFLVNNAKQIFTDAEEPTIPLESDLNEKSTIHLMSTYNYTVIEYDDVTTVPNKTQNAIKFTNVKDIDSENLVNVKITDQAQKEDISKRQLNISEGVLIQRSQHGSKDGQSRTKSSMILNITLPEKDDSAPKRSCIECNNVLSMDCNDPKNKLVTSTICTRNEDICYSQHTPFGIVNRGCFNIYNNLTTYVCSCNLCNYISISEMPHIFSTKRDWIGNVIELTRTKSFRKTIFKDMSCLTCEINAYDENTLVNNTDCIEGNIRTLPIQECDENEICGVKAIRSTGYIWRGCLTSPLYNYWWTFCDSDLCNYDSLVSIYGELL